MFTILFKVINVVIYNLLPNSNIILVIFFRYVFTIVSYLIGVFVFATIVGKLMCVGVCACVCARVCVVKQIKTLK